MLSPDSQPALRAHSRLRASHCDDLIAVFVALALATTLGGCASVGDGMASSAFVDPAKYDLYDCKQLEAERTSLTTRSADQQKLIDKASTGVGGAVIGEMVYRSEYTAMRAQLKLANENWERSRCASAPASIAATPPPPTPPVAAAPAKRR